MNIQKILRKYKKEIDKRLNLFFKSKIKELESISPLASNMAREIRNFTMSDGKRIRPILVYFGYLAAGGKNKKAILDTCIFVELVHSYLLIHDDIIDRDQVRRGKPTVHCQYQEIYKELSKESEHLGLCGGILAGDLASVFSYEILAQSNFRPELKTKAIKRLNQVLENVISGQTLDIFLGMGRQLTKKDIFKILEYKTARYTIEGPLQTGAILAGANKKTLQTLSQYALPLGIAFQLKDDILGMFGNPKITGKAVGADIKEGKQTLLILEAKRQADKKQKKFIRQVFGNRKTTAVQIEKMKEIVRQTGALDFVIDEAEKLANQAKQVIEKSNFSQDVRQSLTEIADYILKRER